MRYYILLFFALTLTFTSCRKDFDTIPSSGKLEFSKTTVYLDTIFTNVSSSTYMLKVYNKSNDDITIPSIALAKGNASKYRLMVDGTSGLDGPDANTIGDGKIFPNVEILANDSLFVFIEATAGIADANPTDLLYTDEILFDGFSAFQQKINLVTLIQDAVFLYPERYGNPTIGYSYEGLQVGSNPADKIYGFYLDASELTFTNLKPYVIYGYAAVKSGDVLNIQPGARVHFHDQSGIIVGNNGSIRVNGIPSLTPLLEKEVIFEGDRLEPNFAETPGQWGTILLTDGSTNNSFSNLTIKNASVGLFIQNQDATTVHIKNTQIYNSSNVGLLARTAKIDGQNIVINNAGQNALACTYGGTYSFKHCTFTDYWVGSARQSQTVLLTNSIKINDIVLDKDLTANLVNCIIYGPNNIELGISKKVDPAAPIFNVSLNYCLVKFNDINNQFISNSLYTSAFLNTTNNNLIANNFNSYDPRFKNVIKNKLNIQAGSSVIGKGIFDPLVPTDILNNLHPSNPDIGAYQFIP